MWDVLLRYVIATSFNEFYYDTEIEKNHGSYWLYRIWRSNLVGRI